MPERDEVVAADYIFLRSGLENGDSVAEPLPSSLASSALCCCWSCGFERYTQFNRSRSVRVFCVATPKEYTVKKNY